MKKHNRVIFPLTALAVSAAILFTSCKASIVLAEHDGGKGYIYYSGGEISGVPYSTEKPIQTSAPAASTTSTQSTTVKTKPVSETGVSAVETDSVPQTVLPETPAPATQPPATEKPKPASSKKPSAASPAVPQDDLPVNSYSALNYGTVKGVWISYFELYPILTGKTASQFRSGIGEYYDNALSLGINTVYVHVRPYGDALYDSEYYPWSKYCTGYIGEAPSFDPLKIMIEEAHKRDLSFQAWVNPLRCYHEDDAPYVSDAYLTGQWYDNNDGDYIVKVSGYWYLNPAYAEVRKLIALGVAEIVSNYDVDGVHIDDYFYPTTEEWFDDIAYNASSYYDLSDFRLDNCSKMVSEMYNAVKSHNGSALFGISTQGNISNNIYTLYADVEKWCREPGYADYMAPQIYYGFENSAQPFKTVVEQWDDMLAGTGKKLIPGLAVYKIGTEDTWAGSGIYEWMNGSAIIKRQIQTSQAASTYGGVILYSYQFIFSPESSVASAVKKEIEAFRPLLV